MNIFSIINELSHLEKKLSLDFWFFVLAHSNKIEKCWWLRYVNLLFHLRFNFCEYSSHHLQNSLFMRINYLRELHPKTNSNTEFIIVFCPTWKNHAIAKRNQNTIRNRKKTLMEWFFPEKFLLWDMQKLSWVFYNKMLQQLWNPLTLRIIKTFNTHC